MRHPTILDAVEDVLGPNLRVWSTSFFIKEARDSAYVSWHQDATYWGLSEPDVVTAWLAFTDATVENGAMRMVPGSHGEQLAHRDTFAPNNLLSRGQEIAVEIDEARAVRYRASRRRDVAAPPANGPRVARQPVGRPSHRFAIRYVPTHVTQLAGDGDSAMLVRGVDEYHHFAPERPPASDLAPEARAHHADVVARAATILLRGTGVERFR